MSSDIVLLVYFQYLLCSVSKSLGQEISLTSAFFVLRGFNVTNVVDLGMLTLLYDVLSTGIRITWGTYGWPCCQLQMVSVHPGGDH